MCFDSIYLISNHLFNTFLLFIRKLNKILKFKDFNVIYELSDETHKQTNAVNIPESRLFFALGFGRTKCLKPFRRPFGPSVSQRSSSLTVRLLFWYFFSSLIMSCVLTDCVISDTIGSQSHQTTDRRKARCGKKRCPLPISAALLAVR